MVRIVLLVLALGGGLPHLGNLLDLAAVWTAGNHIDPNGATATSDAGGHFDPDGSTAGSDAGGHFDPNG